MKNVMIDLETMSTEPTAAIVSIGAVSFDVESETILDKFYQNVSLESCIYRGMHRSQSTMDWWDRPELKQAKEAIQKDTVDISTALVMFSDWCGPHDELIPWGNPSTFDIVILENGYKACDFKKPWHFYNISCYRTLRRLFPTVMTPRAASAVRHHALDDAEYQARHVMRVLRAIKMADAS